jgi:hypothetical protein
VVVGLVVVVVVFPYRRPEGAAGDRPLAVVVVVLVKCQGSSFVVHGLFHTITDCHHDHPGNTVGVAVLLFVVVLDRRVKNNGTSRRPQQVIHQCWRVHRHQTGRMIRHPRHPPPLLAGPYRAFLMTTMRIGSWREMARCYSTTTTTITINSIMDAPLKGRTPNSGAVGISARPPNFTAISPPPPAQRRLLLLLLLLVVVFLLRPGDDDDCAFDLLQRTAPAVTDPHFLRAVIVVNNDIQQLIGSPFSHHPGTTWTPYEITFTVGEWWFVGGFGDTTNYNAAVYGDWQVGVDNVTIASAADIQSVLENVTDLLILGEYQEGHDTAGLDNVVWDCRSE